MKKIKTLICLLVFLVSLFLIDIIIGNPIKKTFNINENIGITNDNSVCNAKKSLDKIFPLNISSKYGNGLCSPNLSLLANSVKGDDQPLFYGF